MIKVLHEKLPDAVEDANVDSNLIRKCFSNDAMVVGHGRLG